MIPFTPKSSFIAAFSIGSLCLAPAGHGQCQYEITAIIQGPECGFLGHGSTIVRGLSEAGEVVGAYGCPGGYATPFYWSEKTGLVMLETPDWLPYAATANDIADDGTIVGVGDKPIVGQRAFHYKDGVWTELPPVDPDNGWSWANAISPDGKYVVGWRSVTRDINPYNAFIWYKRTGEFLDLGMMNGPYSEANDVNAAGVVVGRTGSYLGEPGDSPFVYFEGNLDVSGPAPGALYSTAWAVNSKSQVACTSVVSTDPVIGTPALYTNGEWTELPGLEAYASSGVLDINDLGQPVGSAGSPGVPTHACLWHDGIAFDVNDLVLAEKKVELRSALAINNSGQILCSGRFNNDTVGVLLTPLFAAADLNHDCEIGAVDLALLLSEWGSQDESAADLNTDGIVGPADLGELLASWL